MHLVSFYFLYDGVYMLNQTSMNVKRGQIVQIQWGEGKKIKWSVIILKRKRIEAKEDI